MAHKEFCTCLRCAAGATPEPRRKRSTNPYVAKAVEAQIGELTAPLEGWQGHPELPVTVADYDRYDVAYGSALRRCRHRDGVEPGALNSWRCVMCGQQFDLTTLPHRYREFWM